jgi:hypothetical protein
VIPGQGYAIQDHGGWWPVNMPELEEYLRLVDLRELLSEDISARDKCQKIAKEQLLSHTKTALAAWRGKPPDPSIFAKSADRLVCAQCYAVNVEDPHIFSKAASVEKLKNAMLQRASSNESDSNSSDKLLRSRLDKSGSMQEFCNHAHKIRLEDLLSRDAVLEAVPCPSCLQRENVPPFCFDRRECLLSFRAEALKKSRAVTVDCPSCEKMGRTHKFPIVDIVVPDVYMSFHWGVLNQKTSTYSTQELVDSLQQAIEHGADVCTWYDVCPKPSKEMYQGVAKSIVVIIFFSDAYCGSPRCISEFLHTVNNCKYIIPVLVPGNDDAGWTGPGAEDKEWWQHTTKCSSCQDPRTGKRFSWAPLAQFPPIDMRVKVKGRAGAQEIKRVREGAVMEIVKRIQSRFHSGEHVQQMQRMYTFWKKAALFDSFEAARNDTVKLKLEAAALFEKLDVDKDGCIDRSEILKGFPQLDEKTAEILIAEVDTDGDGNARTHACMHAFIHTCIHINTCIRVHRRTHKYIHVNIYTHTYTHTHTHTNARAHTLTHIDTHALTQVIFRLKSFGLQSKSSFRSEADLGWEEVKEQKKNYSFTAARDAAATAVCVCVC